MPDARSVALIGSKTVLALASVLVLTATGYGWTTVTNADAGLTKVDVIDSGPGGPKGPGQDMNVLLVGMDSRTDAHGNALSRAELDPLHAGPDEGEIETDTMIIVHVPGNGTAASAFSIPRDSYVNVEGEQGKDKINAAFGYGMNEEKARLKGQGVTDQARLLREGMNAGRVRVRKTIENLTGIKIDHYAEVNLFGFAKISDAVGGVPVCLKYDTSDKDSGANFQHGDQTVQGLSALQFVRQRHGPGLINELDRERRQQVFLASMAHKMLSAGVLANPAKLGGIISAVQDFITLDTNWNLLQFAGQMQGLTGGSIKFNIMPVANVDGKIIVNGQSVDVVFVTPADVQAWVAGLFSGVGQPPVPSGAAPPSSGAPHAVTVDVSNASGVSGLAASVMDVLVGKGYARGTPDTAKTTRQTSLVQYAPADKDAATQVATVLDLSDQMAPNTSLTPGHVQVLLGKAYHGPGSAGKRFAGDGLVQMAPAPNTTVTPDRPEINAEDKNCIA